MTSQKNENSGLRFCPFSWIKVTEPPGCLSSLFGGGEKEVWKPQPCMSSSCQLWDDKEKDCGLVTNKSIKS